MIFTADRACRPDCVFVRQHLKNLGEDYRSIILGLQYGNIPAVNPLRALYNFTDRPWVVSYCDVLCTFLLFHSFHLICFSLSLLSSCSSSSPVLTVNHDPAKARQGELSFNRANILSELQRNGESQMITTVARNTSLLSLHHYPNSFICVIVVMHDCASSTPCSDLCNT